MAAAPHDLTLDLRAWAQGDVQALDRVAPTLDQKVARELRLGEAWLRKQISEAR